MPGKVESKTTSTRIGPTSADLFDFDQTGSLSGPGPRICRIIPVAPVGPQDVLLLVGRVRWPGNPPIARALAAALAERGLPQTELTDGHSQGSDRWHPIPHQGIDGKVGEFDVLVGTAEFLEDAGVPIPDAIRALLVDHEAQGWQPILVGACRGGQGTHNLRRSLIGIISIESPVSEGALDLQRTGSASRPESLPGGNPQFRRFSRWPGIARQGPVFLTRRRLCIVGLVLASAFAGLWFSSLTVQADELAVVQRFGRSVTLLQPGIHVRPWWPFETITRIQPRAVRTVVVGSPFTTAIVDSEQPPGELMPTGDIWPAEPAASQSALFAVPVNIGRSVPQLLRVHARVQYGIADPYAFLFNNQDPDRLVAAAADSVLRAIIAARSASVCLGGGRAVIPDRAARILQEKLDGMGSGIAIIAVLLDSIEPCEGNRASRTRDPISDRIEAGIAAQAEGDRFVAAARAKALGVVAAAEKDRDHRVQESRRLLEEVQAIAPAYSHDPEGTRRRLLIELANEIPGGVRQLRQILAESMSSSRRPAATQQGGGR